ncbi:31766_t:CDS:2, partial [Racocetra persica]
RDINVNPHLWTDKFSLVPFTDPNGKPYWTKDYNFIPNDKSQKMFTPPQGGNKHADLIYADGIDK